MKNFYRFCTVVALVLVIGYFFWPTATPQRREPEIAKAKPVAPPVQPLKETIVEPLPAPPAAEPSLPAESPSEPVAPEPVETVENPDEELVEDDVTLKKELEEEFHALTDELEQLDPNSPDQEMIQEEIREVVDALSGLMRKMGVSGYEAPNGWYIVEEPGGTYGHGK